MRVLNVKGGAKMVLPNTTEQNSELQVIVLNLTPHNLTEDQRNAGAVEPASKKIVKRLLTFTEQPTIEEVQQRANELARIAYTEWEYDLDQSHIRKNNRYVMVGGPLYLIPKVDIALRNLGLIPVYAFATRESIDIVYSDGTTGKSQIFKHIAFIGV